MKLVWCRYGDCVRRKKGLSWGGKFEKRNISVESLLAYLAGKAYLVSLFNSHISVVHSKHVCLVGWRLAVAHLGLFLAFFQLSVSEWPIFVRGPVWVQGLQDASQKGWRKRTLQEDRNEEEREGHWGEWEFRGGLAQIYGSDISVLMNQMLCNMYVLQSSNHRW